MKTLISTLTLVVILTLNTTAQTKYTGGNGDGYSSESASFTGTGALPVKLISFTAKVNEQLPLLTWKTGSEKNNDFFTLERRNTDGTWTRIGDIRSKGNSNGMRTYTHTDDSAAGLCGTLVYRLLQTDIDGSTKLAGYASVQLTVAETPAAIRFYPNPATDLLNIETANAGSLSIASLDGRMVHTQPLQAGNNSVPLNLKSGIYLILINGDCLPSGKLIIQ